MIHEDRANADDLDPQERRLLETMPIEIPPPPDLEERLTRTLRRRRLVRRGPAVRWWRAAAGVAAAAVLVAGGFALGRGTQAHPGTGMVAPGGQPFLLLLYEDAGFRPRGTPADLVREYGAWLHASLPDSSDIIWADELGASGTVVASTGARDGVVETSAGTLTGFALVRAADHGAAVRLAEGSPHVRYGGRIAVRAVSQVR